MAKPARASSGRACPNHTFFFEDNDIRHSAFRKVVRNTKAHHAATDDYDFSLSLHLG
jgi:hypothetical protein